MRKIKIFILLIIYIIKFIPFVVLALPIGDVDGNGMTDSLDYILVKKHLLGISILTGDKLTRADVNGDGNVSPLDYIVIKKIIIGLIGGGPTPTVTPNPSTTPTSKYEVKYYGASIIETGLPNSLVLSGNVAIPVYASNKISLSTNTKYVVSFDYETSGGTNQFDVDLFPDSLPQVNPTATTSSKHYDWEVSSTDSAMSSSNLRFFDDIQEANEKDITISNIYMGTVRIDTKMSGETLGTLPSPTKSNAKFLGWYTSPTGGNMVSSSTVVTENMTLYPHWEVSYNIATDSKFDAYTQKSSCTSSTMSFRIIEISGNYYALVWVSDANRQINNGLAAFDAQGVASAETILSSRASSGKCFIGVNASFFTNGTPDSDVVIAEGNVAKNKGTSSAVMGINKNGVLNLYIGKTAQELLSDGVRNTFKISNNVSIDNSAVIAGRTQIYQYDKNNFVIYSGSGTVLSGLQNVQKYISNKITDGFNLDGGGSRKLYYQTKNSNLSKLFGGDRKIPDTLYVIE